MNLLLDTNALLWWLAGSDRVAGEARAAIANPANTVHVSSVSAWEIAIKAGLRRLDAPPDLASWLPQALAENRFTPLSITMTHAVGVGSLPRHHSDPFDRLLIAQALAEGCWLVTGDRAFEPYGVPLIAC